ncbi:serine hydrolase [Streptomyces tendae]|uniref:serine hydrolase n=1 Tax=Streptomyces tendae TaxID=1932 RepID=UPI003723B3F6
MSDRHSAPASASVPSRPGKRRGRVLSVVAALAVLGGGLAVTGSPAYGAPGHAGHRDAVREGAKDLVREDGFPAALVADQGRDGRVRDYTAGTGDLETGASVPVDGQVRAGSNTKALTAAVVLQLVGEGKEMQTTVPVTEGAPAPGTGYGVGLFRTPLSCGVQLWGHGGSIHGYREPCAVHRASARW